MLAPKIQSVKGAMGIIRAEIECWAQHEGEADSRTSGRYQFALGAPESLRDSRCAARYDAAMDYTGKLDKLAATLDKRMGLGAGVRKVTPQPMQPWQARAAPARPSRRPPPRVRHDASTSK